MQQHLHPSTLVEHSGSHLRFCSSVTQNPRAVFDAALLAAATGAALTSDALDQALAAPVTRDNLPSWQLHSFWSELLTAPAPSNGLRLLRATGRDRLFPDLVAVQGVPQSPRWHPEGDVWEHTLQVTDAAARLAAAAGLDAGDRLVSTLAALCHDFGKALSTQVHADGSVTSWGHEETGEEPAMSFVLTAGFEPTMARAVGALVRTHMAHAHPPSARSLARMESRLKQGGATFEQWCVVADADGAGRGSASVEGSADSWRELSARRKALRAE